MQRRLFAYGLPIHASGWFQHVVLVSVRKAVLEEVETIIKAALHTSHTLSVALEVR